MLETPVLVLGDLMLDHHVHGHVRRISPEAPVPVVSLVSESDSPGGAGNVAATLAGLGCPVTLAGLFGADVEGRRLRISLEACGVGTVLGVEHPGLSTITKTRILSSESYQQLLRLDRDGSRMAFAAAAPALLEVVLPRLAEHRAVVLADYEKGVLTPEVLRAVTARCRELGIPCVVDPKKSDFQVYAGATVVTPNLMEAERAAGRALPDDTTVATAAAELRETLELDAMLITRGAQGMTLEQRSGDHPCAGRGSRSSGRDGRGRHSGGGASRLPGGRLADC